MKIDLNQKIEDDNRSLCGGTSYEGETLKNFMQEVGMPLNSSLEKINKALCECGIKPIGTETEVRLQETINDLTYLQECIHSEKTVIDGGTEDRDKDKIERNLALDIQDLEFILNIIKKGE